MAPFVLMGLIYTNKNLRVIVNCDICPLTLYAISLLNLQYAHDLNSNPTLAVNTGDHFSLELNYGVVRLNVIYRVSED